MTHRHDAYVFEALKGALGRDPNPEEYANAVAKVQEYDADAFLIEEETKAKKFRFLRVLEYVGERKWIDEAIERRGVKGIIKIPRRIEIREAILGDVAELFPQEEVEDGE